MSLILAVILLVVGLIAIIGAVNRIVERNYYASQNMLLIDVVIFIMYILVCGFTGMLYFYSGRAMIFVYIMLGLVAAALTSGFLITCLRDRDNMKKEPVAIFLVYFAIVLYLTEFMRIGTVTTSIVTTPFEGIGFIGGNGDAATLYHMGLNVLMFLPFGYLIPAMNPRHLHGWYYSLLGGLVSSTIIEGVQMVFHLGQANVNDIIANTFGAVLGYVMFSFVWKVRQNWTL